MFSQQLPTEPSLQSLRAKLSSQQTCGQEAFSGLVVQPPRLASSCKLLSLKVWWSSILRGARTILFRFLRGKVMLVEAASALALGGLAASQCGPVFFPPFWLAETLL